MHLEQVHSHHVQEIVTNTRSLVSAIWIVLVLAILFTLVLASCYSFILAIRIIPVFAICFISVLVIHFRAQNQVRCAPQYYLVLPIPRLFPLVANAGQLANSDRLRDDYLTVLFPVLGSNFSTPFASCSCL